MDIRRLVRSRRATAVAAVALTLALASGTTAAGLLGRAGDDAAAAAFALRGTAARAAVDTTFQRYADTAHDLVAAAATRSAGDLTRELGQVTGDRLPGAHEVLVVGPDGTVVTQRALDGSNPPPSARFVAGPEVAQAMRLSRSRGRLVTSSAHVLRADADLPPTHRRPAFVLAAPVHATDAGFVGWVLVSARAGDLLETTLHDAGVTGVATILQEVAADGTEREVARWADGGASDRPDRETVELTLAGNPWRLVVQPTTPLPGADRTATETLTLIAMVLAGLLLAGLLLTQGAAHDRAVARAARADAARREGDRRALRAEAALREQGAELAGFATSASEHLHGPLNTIAGFTDLLLEDAAPQLDPAARGFLDRIGHSTSRMLTLVDGLLAYTAATEAALRLEPVDAARLAADVVADKVGVTPGDRPSIDIGPLPVVTADAALLGQVLDQLIGNAVRFVRHGGTARVTVGARQSATGWWRIEVADRGIGVPPEHHSRIFTPFHRTPAAEGFPGIGLGLATCRRIVAQHGGEIGVEPNPGGGSIFWFTIPGTGFGRHCGQHPQLSAGLA